MVEDLVLKQGRADGWSELAGREATLIERCAAGDQLACAELVAEHERMVFQLALNLLGDRDEAFDWLTRAVQERSGWIAYLRVDPRLDSLHGDARFERLFASARPQAQMSAGS